MPTFKVRFKIQVFFLIIKVYTKINILLGHQPGNIGVLVGCGEGVHNGAGCHLLLHVHGDEGGLRAPRRAELRREVVHIDDGENQITNPDLRYKTEFIIAR